MNNWQAMKPTMPWGQLPCLTWNGERLCQSMTICRFLAREMGIAGRNSLEMAQVDEIVDVIQDVITANVNFNHRVRSHHAGVAFGVNNCLLEVLS